MKLYIAKIMGMWLVMLLIGYVGSLLALNWFFSFGDSAIARACTELTDDLQHHSSLHLALPPFHGKEFQAAPGKWWCRSELHFQIWQRFVDQVADEERREARGDGWTVSRALPEDQSWRQRVEPGAPAWWNVDAAQLWGPAVIVRQSGKVKYIMLGDRDGSVRVFRTAN